MKLSIASLFLLAVASVASAQKPDVQPFLTPCETLSDYDYDSGVVASASTDVSLPGAMWIQLNLAGTVLAPGATVVVTGGVKSGTASQTITAESLSAENYFSAQFDGDGVSVELVPSGRGGASEEESRLVVRGINSSSGPCEDNFNPTSICGAVDDRVPSTDPRQGRIGGCTGWLISEDVFVQAGHCGTPSSSTRMHFTYGVSSAPVEDQYAVVAGSYTGVNGGVGNDWGVGRLLPNSVTGKLPGIAQSEIAGTPGAGWYTMGAVPSSTSGNNIRITGYGTAAVDSRSQKTHTGGLVSIGTTSLGYVPDTTGGNSGSPVVHVETGDAIGVHTHGGCSENGGSNAGTRADVAAFEAARNLLLNPGPPTPPPTPVPCPPGQSRIKVAVTTDNYPVETTWSLSGRCESTAEVLSGGPYSDPNTPHEETTCLPPTGYRFVINDSFGDGICCTYGSGSYTITDDGILVESGGSFGSSEEKEFGTCATTPTPPPTTTPPTPPPTTAPPTTAPPTTPPPTSCKVIDVEVLDDQGNSIIKTIPVVGEVKSIKHKFVEAASSTGCAA